MHYGNSHLVLSVLSSGPGGPLRDFFLRGQLGCMVVVWHGSPRVYLLRSGFGTGPSTAASRAPRLVQNGGSSDTACRYSFRRPSSAVRRACSIRYSYAGLRQWGSRPYAIYPLLLRLGPLWQGQTR